MPDHHWPTATLLRVVHDELLAQPTVRGHYRGTIITMGLARLAERGIPADCIVRTCAGPALVRRILVTVSGVWAATKRGDVDRANAPDLEAWFQLLESCPQIAALESPDIAAITPRAMTGNIREVADEWLATASITHIIGWRLDDYLRVTPSSEDLTLKSGSSGTRWIYDRFTTTYPSYWHPTSLEWEASFKSHPERIAGTLGLAPSILNERAVSCEALAEARLGVILGESSCITVDGMSGAEVFEAVLSLIEAGGLRAARDLAGRAFLQHPNEATFRLTYAFCLIPSNANEAERLLNELPVADWIETVVDLDRATILLMRGDMSAAIEVAQRVDAQENSAAAWLWDPESLPSEPKVIYCSPREWFVRLSSRNTAGQPSSAR